MMTSVHKKSNRTLLPGLTLLEIMIAVAIITIMFTIGIVGFRGDSKERTFQRAITELEALSGLGKAQAFKQKRPYRLVFQTSNKVILERLSDDNEEGNLAIESLELEPNLSILRWGTKDDEWIKPDIQSEVPLTWSFSPSGLCEPISIKLEMEESWVILHMDPLTALIQDQESYITE